jgi:DNA adenine methylase
MAGSHQGPVVLLNQATDRAVALYRDVGYDLMLLTGPHPTSCTGDRTPAKEVLATRNL